MVSKTSSGFFLRSSRYWITVSTPLLNHRRSRGEVTAGRPRSQAEPTLVRLPANVGVVRTTLGMHTQPHCALAGVSGLRGVGGVSPSSWPLLSLLTLGPNMEMGYTSVKADRPHTKTSCWG